MASDNVELIGVILEEQTQLTLVEISRGCAVHAECIIELVEEGVLAPAGHDPRTWRFTGVQLRRASIALHNLFMTVKLNGRRHADPRAHVLLSDLAPTRPVKAWLPP